MSSTCPHNMVNFSLLTAQIVSLVCGTPANFNGFRVLASLLQRCRSTEANQTAQCLALTWAGRLYIHFRQLLLHNGILSGAKLTLHPPSLALFYWQRYCTAVEQWARAKLCGIEQRAPPTFGRAAITLGIGPHSSTVLFSSDQQFVEVYLQSLHTANQATVLIVVYFLLKIVGKRSFKQQLHIVLLSHSVHTELTSASSRPRALASLLLVWMTQILSINLQPLQTTTSTTFSTVTLQK